MGMTMKNKLLTSIVIVNSGVGLYAPTVVAEDALRLEEIVVTAQRREQNLQDVPVSVTAFSGAVIEQNNITEAADYLALTPNVSFTEGFSTGARGLGLGVRGITNNVTDENSFVNSIGVYLDEFSVGAVPTGVANPQLEDVERIEVLRGPQGTFFGRNSLGGALNISTKKPTDEFEGKITLDGESFDDAGEQYGVSGMVNLPFSDNFAIRAVLSYEDSSGMVENVNPGGNDSDHEYWMGRIALRWNLSDATTANFMLMHTDEEQGSDENVPSGVWDLDTIDTFGLGLPGSLPGPIDANILNGDPIGFYPDNRSKTSRDLNEYNNNKATLAILNIAHELNDNLVLKSITGFIDTENERLFDQDLLGGGNSPQGNALSRQNELEGESWSTELRLEYTSDSFDLIGGILYAEDEIIRGGDGVRTAGEGLTNLNGFFVFPPLPAGIPLSSVHKKFESESLALFSDFTWHTTEKLDLIFGFRYTHDTITNELTNPSTGRPGGSAEEDFNDVSPRFVARYQLNDDASIYANISKGYKAGGTSLNNGPGPQRAFLASPYDEEVLWNYEIGFKSEWMDNRLRLNGALFYLDWSDLQMESFRLLTPGDLTSNAEFAINIDDAEALGAELELVALITDNFTLSAALGILETEVTCSCDAVIKAGFNVDLEGIELPRSPELTATISGEYRWLIGNNEAWVRVDYIHRGSQTTDIEGATYRQTSGRPTPSGTGFVPAVVNGFPYVAPSYDLVNLRAGYDIGEQWAITVFAENLFDEEYYTGTQEDFGLSGFRLRPHPQIFGGSISYSF